MVHCRRSGTQVAVSGTSPKNCIAEEMDPRWPRRLNKALSGTQCHYQQHLTPLVTFPRVFHQRTSPLDRPHSTLQGAARETNQRSAGEPQTDCALLFLQTLMFNSTRTDVSEGGAGVQTESTEHNPVAHFDSYWLSAETASACHLVHHRQLRDGSVQLPPSHKTCCVC